MSGIHSLASLLLLSTSCFQQKITIMYICVVCFSTFQNSISIYTLVMMMIFFWRIPIHVKDSQFAFKWDVQKFWRLIFKLKSFERKFSISKFCDRFHCQWQQLNQKHLDGHPSLKIHGDRHELKEKQKSLSHEKERWLNLNNHEEYHWKVFTVKEFLSPHLN